MSGVEILGVIGTAATVADLAAKIWKHLDRFVQRSKEADAVARDLQAKVHQLRTYSRTVQRAGRSRRRQARSEEQDLDEVEIWKTISRTINQCKRMFQRFEAALEGLVTGKEDSGWLSKALLQRRIERRQPTIARLEKKIDLHLTTLNISILSVHFLVHMAHHDEIMSMFAGGHLAIMNRLDDSLRNGRVQLDRDSKIQVEPGEPPTLDTDSAIAISMEEGELEIDCHQDEILALRVALDAGATVRARSVHNPDAESLRSPLTSSPSVSSGNTRSLDPSLTEVTSIVSSWSNAVGGRDDDRLMDPTPYFDDTTPREVLEALIERLRRQVELDFSAGRYHQAEENQLEAIIHLEELYIGYGEPFEDAHKEKMQTQLAEIYLMQGKREEAHKLLVAGFQDKSMHGVVNVVKAPTMVNFGVTPASARRYYLLALTHQGQYQDLPDQSEKRLFYLDAAEREAKRAFKCSFEARDTPDATFKQTVTLLIQIYEDKGKLVHAATYQDLFLRQSEASQDPPSSLSLALYPPITHQNTPTIHSNASTIDVRRSSDATPSERIAAIAAARDDQLDNLLQDADLERCIMDAVGMRNEKAIRKLHHRGAGLDQALFQAVRTGDVDMTRLLLKLDANKEAKEASGLTPLLVAAGSTHEPVVRALLEEGVDVEAQGHGWSAIHWAANRSSVQVLCTLLEPQFRLNKDAVCEAGKTALHYLAETGRVDLADVLLRHGAGFDIKDNAGRTPLYIAVQRRKYDFVSMLIKHGVTFEEGSLPDSSQAMRNLLGPAQRPLTATTRRISSDTTTSRPTLRSMFGSGGGLKLRRPKTLD